jgi:hypothetical protein
MNLQSLLCRLGARSPLGLLLAALAACGPDGSAGLSVVDNEPPVASDSLAEADSLPAPDSLPKPDSLPQPDSIPPRDSLQDSLPPPDSTPTLDPAGQVSGMLYGPIGLWNSDTTMAWGPQPFTGTQNYTEASGVIRQIETARAEKHRLVLAMTGGPAERYTTGGRFDFGKWKRKMDTFESNAIRSAVAAGVADGTIIANQLIDEPETRRWGGNISKDVIDQMAAYAKRIFPTLPMGINHGPPAYGWRTSERFHVLDYVLYQYNHFITAGDVAQWRDMALAQAKRDGVTPAFSLNILDGGVQDRSSSYSCSARGQAGRGTYRPNCRMTPTQLREWAESLTSAGCMLLMWRFDRTYMSDAANQNAFRDVAELLRHAPGRSCLRP